MSYQDTYKEWCVNPYFSEETRAELKSIEGNDKEIEDRFYRELEFGTGGLRGVIGNGTNRMNVYTVRKATQGLANFIIKVRCLAPPGSSLLVARSLLFRFFAQVPILQGL